MDELSDRISGLSPAKRSLIEKKLKEKGRRLPSRQAVLQKEKYASLPLSFAQERLWFLEQFEPGNPVNHRPAVFRIKGLLNVDALKKSINEIVLRHEILRTTFEATDGKPLQIINPSEAVDIKIRDLSNISGTDREAEAIREITEESGYPFDLGKGPLLRIALIRLTKTEHILQIVMHHIIFDGWSTSVFLQELSALYEAYAKGGASPLPELTIQYADYAVWQRQWMQGEVLEKQVTYWKRKLEAVPPVLELPLDRPRPAIDTYKGAIETLVLPGELAEEVKALSRRENVTLFMTLLAAFKVLLYSYTGSEDIVTGTPIANRTRVELEDLIGFFVNTLVLRTDLSGEPTFRELLGRVRETTLEAYSHQDLPFEKLVEVLKPERNMSITPIFQVMFNLEDIGREVVQPQDLKIEEADFDSGVARFDLTVEILNKPEGYCCFFQYNAALFDAATIRRMTGHFMALLEGVIADPGQGISCLPILTEAERHQLLVEWNDTRKDYPGNKCIHQLFEEQVVRTPDAVAIVYKDKQLTYRELNTLSNQLAHYLIGLGVGPEIMVGICAERSLEMLAGLLGILKAGGAYVPLDPACPEKRLQHMMEDTAVSVVLTQEHLVSRLPKSEVNVVCLDKDWEEIARKGTKNPESKGTSQNLAYVIYTSGSTGTPKGVQISHVALTNVLTSIQQIPGICESDVLLAITTLSFDMAALELFLPLMTGSCVVIAPSDSTYDASLLMEIIRCSGATLMQATPATWNMLISAGWEGSTKLKVLCGGEALTNKLAVQLLPRVKELWNLYGPTETTIFSSVYQVRQSSVIYTGCPIANTQIYILDAHLQPVALGVPGELHIGGDGLARGYLNLPELTAEKFVPDPFSGAPGARLYKTGDFASYAPDGNIRFLGRRDDQIKIRGFRIELQEIGSILAQHDSIKEAIVVASEDIAGEKRLVAYVVPKKASEVSTDGLKYYLAKCLPDYMVPFFFVFLDALPLTSNGKIDRKILPAPDFSHRFLQEAYVPPRTLAEEVITDILAEVLGIGSIGIHDNFFALGGHSILATQVISRLNMTFNITIPLRSFFEMPTVSGLSGVIEEFKAVNKATDSDEVHGRSALSPIKHALLEKTEKGQDAYLPQRRSIHRGSTRLSDNLSFAQERLWFLNRMDPDNHSYNVASGLRLKGKLRRHALQKSLDEIVRRHEVLRTNFAAQDGSPVLVIHPVTGVQIREIDLAGKPASDREAETADILAEEAQRSFDLSTGPLLRVLLLRLHEQEHILLVTVQHIVYDGWSGGVFLRELSVLYEAYAKGEASPLPELKMQYADYAVWQRQWLQGEVLEKQLSYWKQKLQGAPPVLELPLDRPRTAVQTYKGARESLALSSGFTEALKALSQRENVTLFMTLLAAFQVLLYRYTGSEDIVTGTPVANRTLVEIEDLIGFFVNTLVLRTDLSGDPTFREVLGRVRETTLDAYGYQDLPFERLVEELRPERNLSHAPLFQVFFNMASQQQNIANFYDMTVEPLMLPGMQSKFDLTLYVKEQSNNILLSIVYNADLFDSARIHEMLAQYQLLLERMTEEPQLRISGFSLVTQHSGRILPDPAEKLAEPCYEPVTHIFASWALRSPSTPAVSQGGHVRTYRELADSASMLARILVAQGMRPGEVTVLVGPRSYGFVTGFLAVFLSGGVILPIDQRLPADRQRLLLQEANTTRLLYIGELRSEDAWMMEFVPSSFLLDPDEGHVVSPVNNPTNIENQMLPQLSPDDPACIFFTSGTTGVPRGVLGSHKGLSHFLLWQRDTFSVSTEDRCAQLTGPSFDVILRDIFLPLISGAMICLPPKDIDISSEDILSWLAFEKITLLHIVPSLAQNWLLNQGGKTLLPQLRCIFFSGEPLTDQLVLQWRETLPGPGMIINLYGPTETTMVKSFFVVPSAIPPGIQSAGRPLPQTQTLVLSKTGQLCGIGEPGEIVIRTPFRTLGYINFPEEVSGRFVKNPFRDDKDDLLYYTGDLGRYCPDGSLDILGRMDDQVKIRGVRIEPAEVAAVLAGHPDVKACIVASRKDLRQETVLVAYVVPSSADRPAFSELGLYLGKRLPLVMVPSAFVFLESLPLTPNGKVDRRALPGPDLFQLDSAESFVSPGTPEEQSIAGIWSEVLGIQRIGIYDNFFALGGHSLLATRVVSRMNRIFNITIPLRSFFEAPTVSGLSSLMQDIRWQIQGKDPIRNKSDEHASGEL